MWNGVGDALYVFCFCTGIPGFQGLPGLPTMSIKGSKGVRGADGIQGPMGPAGDSGPPGPKVSERNTTCFLLNCKFPSYHENNTQSERNKCVIKILKWILKTVVIDLSRPKRNHWVFLTCHFFGHWVLQNNINNDMTVSNMRKNWTNYFSCRTFYGHNTLNTFEQKRYVLHSMQILLCLYYWWYLICRE